MANAAMPPSKLPIQPARPFIAPVADVESYGRALDCMTAAVYYEAGSETPQGQAAVAQVVLNRMRHPAYPKTVCGVVFQGSEQTTGCQFTFTCDGSLARTPSALGWTRARAVAGAALNGGVATGVGMATHYHADFVVPYWAPRLVKIGQIGAHIFYRWPGAWGLSSAFSGRYALIEPVESRIAALSSFALRAVDLESTFVLPDLPPLDSVAPVPAAAPRVVLQTSAKAIEIDISPAAPQVRAAAVTPRAPQALADPLSATPATPARSRRIPAPQN
ncbi:cell wall hydrolase [Caulobacter sp. DWR2-3-1b2]|uniref:cell wall hydrolase n=1 Tax=unclassified Caulobacter TaxID=2648921 RepID=UPI003CEA9748